jgi:hypothetical protein
VCIYKYAIPNVYRCMLRMQKQCTRLLVSQERENEKKERKQRQGKERDVQPSRFVVKGAVRAQDATTALDLNGRVDEELVPKVATLCRAASSCFVTGVLSGDHVVGTVRCSSSVSYVETVPMESNEVLSPAAPGTH